MTQDERLEKLFEMSTDLSASIAEAVKKYFNARDIKEYKNTELLYTATMSTLMVAATFVQIAGQDQDRLISSCRVAWELSKTLKEVQDLAKESESSIN